MGTYEKSKQKAINVKNLTTRVSEICEQFGIPEPGLFLAHIMAGFDPRGGGQLYQYLHRLRTKIGDKRPTAAQWERICFLLDLTPNFEPLDLGTSLGAAMRLMDYLHPKQKAFEVSGSLGTVAATVENLTKAEILEFKKLFEKEF
jgi:hypothetical protein